MSASRVVPTVPARTLERAYLADATNRQSQRSDSRPHRAPQRYTSPPPSSSDRPAPVGVQSTSHPSADPHGQAPQVQYRSRSAARQDRPPAINTDFPSASRSNVAPTRTDTRTSLPLRRDAHALNTVINRLRIVWQNVLNEIALDEISPSETYELGKWRDTTNEIRESLTRVDFIMRSYVDVRLVERDEKGDICVARYTQYAAELDGELRGLGELPAPQVVSGILRIDLRTLQNKAKNIRKLERQVKNQVYAFVAHYYRQQELQKRAEMCAFVDAWMQQDCQYHREMDASRKASDRLGDLIMRWR